MSPLYSKDLLREQLIKVLKKHGLRILRPPTDIIFAPNLDQIAVIVDGIDHMTLGKDANEDLSKDEFDGASDEEEVKEGQGDSEEAKAAAKKKEEAKKAEEEIPVIYNCPACTLENPVSVSVCEICGTPRPPIEVIIAEFRAANKPPEELKPSSSSQPEVAIQKKTLTQLKLEAVAEELTCLISRLERKAYREKLDQFKLEQEAAAKLKAQAEEEAKKLEQKAEKQPESAPSKKEEKKEEAFKVKKPRKLSQESKSEHS